MKAWMMALLTSGSRVLKTKTFTANATWPAPTTTNSLTTLVGKGGPGSPGSTSYYYDQVVTVYSQRRDGGGIDQQVVQTSTGIPGVAPADYCDAVVSTPSDPTYSSSQQCYDFTQHSTSNPPTTGASTTGFGKTFPGGTGGAATPVTYNNVAVTPGASYKLVVPAGGSITITYYQ
jgi:hypothetical protein